MNHKSLPRMLLCAALAAALAFPAGGAALGAALPPGFPTPEPGKTTVGVQTADLPPDNLSFTVPLYLTVAAIPEAGGEKLVTPDGYALRNTTASLPDGKYPSIAVTGMAVRGVTGGTWSLTATPQKAKDIALNIGGVTLPAVSAGIADPVEADLTAKTNRFYDSSNGRFTAIEGGPSVAALALPVEGTLSQRFSATPESAAPQFRVTYTVSLLDGSGKPVGAYYKGPTREEAAAPSSTPAPGPAPATP